MRHDEAADQAGARTPAGRPGVLALAVLVEKGDAEGVREALAEEMRRTSLQGEAIAHHGFDRVGRLRAGELLSLGLAARDYRHCELRLREVPIDVQHAEDFFLRLVGGPVGCVTLLPEKLNR